MRLVRLGRGEEKTLPNVSDLSVVRGRKVGGNGLRKKRRKMSCQKINLKKNLGKKKIKGRRQTSLLDFCNGRDQGANHKYKGIRVYLANI